MSGDLFNLFLTGELGFSPAVLSVIYAGMLLSLPLQLTAVIVAAVAVEIAFSPSYGTVWSAWLGEVVRDEDRPTVLSLGKLLP